MKCMHTEKEGHVDRYNIPILQRSAIWNAMTSDLLKLNCYYARNSMCVLIGTSLTDVQIDLGKPQ